MRAIRTVTIATIALTLAMSSSAFAAGTEQPAHPQQAHVHELKTFFTDHREEIRSRPLQVTFTEAGVTAAGLAGLQLGAGVATRIRDGVATRQLKLVEGVAAGVGVALHGRRTTYDAFKVPSGDARVTFGAPLRREQPILVGHAGGEVLHPAVETGAYVGPYVPGAELRFFFKTSPKIATKTRELRRTEKGMALVHQAQTQIVQGRDPQRTIKKAERLRNKLEN